MQLPGRHRAVAGAGRREQQLGKRQALAGRAQSCCLEALDQRAVGTILAHGSRYKVPACPIKVAKTVSCQLLWNRYKRLSLASAPASGAKAGQIAVNHNGRSRPGTEERKSTSLKSRH